MKWATIPASQPVIAECDHCSGEGLGVIKVVTSYGAYCKQVTCRQCKGGGKVIRATTVKERVSKN